MKTVYEVRNSFWAAFPEFRQYYVRGKRQNSYSTDIRCTFVDYVDSLVRDRAISESLGKRVVL